MVNAIRVVGAFFFLMLFAGILFLMLVPFIFIWALNVLLSLHITYTIETWFAALIILLLLGWHKVIPMYSGTTRMRFG